MENRAKKVIEKKKGEIIPGLDKKLLAAPNDEMLNKYLTKYAVPIGILNHYESAPSRSTMLTVMGPPREYGTDERLSPLTFKTYAASGLVKLKPDGYESPMTFFVLQDTLAPGYDGAPVIDMRKIGGTGNPRDEFPMFDKSLDDRRIERWEKTPVFYGLVKGTISDKRGGRLTLVVPSVIVYALVSSAKEATWMNAVSL